MTVANSLPPREHALFPYSALPKREKLVWPGQKTLAMPIYLHFECMDLRAPIGADRAARFKERHQPDLRFHSWYEYGNRVGIFRILELLDRFGLTATVAANASACERYPYLLESFQRRGFEIAAHGLAVNRLVSSAMTAEEEADFTHESVTRIESACGVRPRGWIAQDQGESHRTPQLLADLGMRYVADWPNDDQPYRMPGANHLISLPAPGEWDDQNLLWDRKVQAWHYPPMVMATADQLLAESAVTGRYFALGLHPWLIGAPHRITYLEEVLAQLSGRASIWNASASEIADHFASV
jgi:allantoinase